MGRVFPVIIILRRRDFLTEKMQENINIFFGEFEAYLVGNESVVNVILFSKENHFSMIFFLNSVYLYLELPEKVLLRRESLSI